jgi:drug/metabolite transporter (DMT)-like permease
MVKLLGKFNVYTIITYQNVLGVLWFLPAFLIFDLSHFLKVGFVIGAMVPIIGLSIFASSLAYIFFSYGVQKLGVVKANTLANIIPVITAISSFLFQDEKLTLLNTIGILIVVAGLFMSQVNQTLFARTKIILFMAKRNGNNQLS